jgi:hypothetical protein
MNHVTGSKNSVENIPKNRTEVCLALNQCNNHDTVNGIKMITPPVVIFFKKETRGPLGGPFNGNREEPEASTL